MSEEEMTTSGNTTEEAENKSKSDRLAEIIGGSTAEENKENSVDSETINIDAYINKEFSYAIHHTDCLMRVADNCNSTVFSFIKGIMVTNKSDDTLSNLNISLKFTCDAFSLSDVNLNVPPKSEQLLRMPFLKVKKEYIDTLVEVEPSAVQVIVRNGEGNILCSKEYSFNILPTSQPSFEILTDARLYAKYVTPLSPRVKQIALNAIKYNDNKAIITYQNTGKDRFSAMLKEAQAIYLALHNHGIMYQNPPAGGLYAEVKDGIEIATQRLRMPEEVLKDKKGTCLDLSILFCACLEEVGFNPILIIIDGHAFAGFFLDKEKTFTNGNEQKSGLVYNSASSGMNEIALVECTTFSADNDAPFKESMNIALDHLKMYQGTIFNAIDINTLHKGIFSPIQTDGSNEELENAITPKEVSDTSLDPVVETKFINVMREEEKDRFTFWEKKLLDLTEGNPLVNFRIKPSNCVKIVANENVPMLVAQKETIKLLSLISTKTENETIESGFYSSDVKPSKLPGIEISSDELFAWGYDKTLKTLIKKSNQAMDETGAPTLYLCLGVLTYTRKGHGKGLAPFLVLPVKIVKEKLGNYYNMSYDYDDIMINQTFFEYYKQEHPGVDFGDLYQVSSSDNYSDIVHTFKKCNTEDITLDENTCFVANLTFAHYIMWQDVRKRKDELKKNKVIQSILANRNVLDDTVLDLDKPIDELEKYHDFAAPLYYDSTQLKAILECGEGKSFILDGPPGTGKSQTIVNMIVNAFYHGKTVLFVAEKKAALDVVSDRLNRIQLGRFCLELHSNKANKADFFSKLKESMDMGQTKDPENFDKKCAELEQKRDNILHTINKMHTNTYFYSLYDAIVRKEKLWEQTFSVDFNDEFLISLSQEKKDRIYNNIDSYIASADHIKGFAENPLKVFKTEYINHYDKDNTISDFTEWLNALNEFLKAYNSLLDAMPVKFSLSRKNIVAITELFDLCFNGKIYDQHISDFEILKDDTTNYKVFEDTKAINRIIADNTDSLFVDKFETIDATTALTALREAKGFFKKFFTHLKYKKMLKPILRPRHKVKTHELIARFETIENYNNLAKSIKDNCAFIDKLIGKSYFDTIIDTDDVVSIEQTYRNTRRFVENLTVLENESDLLTLSMFFLNAYSTKNPALKLVYSSVAVKLEQYKQAEKTKQEKYKLDYSVFADEKLDVDALSRLLTYAGKAEHFIELVDIAAINQIATTLKDDGLGDILFGIDQNKFNYKNFKEVFDLSCADSYIKLYFKDNDINFFNPSMFDAEIKKYKALISEYNNLVIECVSARLTKKLNHNNINYANSSPIGRLKKSISNNGRGVTIRDTLLNYDDIIKKYFPCFLMSPLSAAQYLAVDTNGGKSVSKFDLVIFDEASQIPTYEAVGPIARGKSLIVAGDPEQMPPSAYFSAGLELEGDDIQFEDATSLLDECIAIELPRIRLSYHYRSKHESLIDFSNNNFYNGKLYTFPSPNTANSMVSFKYVNLEKAKKDSGITAEEITAICDCFKDIYSNPNTKHKSVGIIVFNMNQQDAVSNAITDLLAKDTALGEIVESAGVKTKEPWFVKSLENVQGDERDIIILSVGFRKNAAGRAVVIGPIARENGQRRLNVAVSRSKEKMIIVSTIKYTDFDTDDTKIKNKGTRLLKSFLRFAEESTFNAHDGAKNSHSSIVDFIKDDLVLRGLDVVENVGNSDFKVDLAIKSKDGKSYVLGILVDSKPISENISCRDKIYVQESVLNMLKWKLISVYSLEYFKDKSGTIDKIITAIDQPYVKEEAKIEPHIEKAAGESLTYNCVPYVKARNLYFSYSNEYGYARSTAGYIKTIVAQESPVAFETIKERVKENSNIQSMSAKAKYRLEMLLHSMHLFATCDQTQAFYWKDENKTVKQFRIDSDRDLNDIAKEEIVCAMNQVLFIQGDVSNEDLYRLTLSAFGYGSATLTKKNTDRLDYVYNWAKKNGCLKPENNVITMKLNETRPSFPSKKI